MSALRSLPAAPLAVLLAILILVRLASARPFPALPVGPDVVAAVLLLYTPLFRYRRRGLPDWIRPGNGRTNLFVGGALALGGAALYLAFASLPLPLPLRPPGGPLPPFAMFLAAQTFLVAVPEEVFFRGYLFDAFAEKGWEPLLATSLLFALAHVAIHATAWRALTFFPGVAFAWARRRTGNVYVPIALHVAYNALPYIAWGAA